MSTTATRSKEATTDARVGKVDMKLEVVTIPVSDVDRATEFYVRLGWRQDVTPPGSGVVQFTPPGSAVLGPIRHEPHVRRARIRPEPVPDRLRHPGCPRRAGRARRRGERGLPPRPGRPRSAVPLPITPATVPSPRSAIRTATAGCCRRSRPGCPAGSTRPRRRSGRRAIWRARCGVRRPPTASTRSAPGSATRTGPTGTPRTWWLSRPGPSCRREIRAHNYAKSIARGASSRAHARRVP